MTIRITARRDDQAFAVTVEGADRPAGLAIRARLMAEGMRFAIPLTALADALTTFATRSVSLIATLLPVALAPAMAALARETTPPAFQALATAIVTGKRDDASRESRINELPASLPFADDDRKAFRDLDIGGQASWIKSASRDQIAAILSAGRTRFAELPQPLWDAAQNRYAVLAHIAKTGLMADYALKPSADQPAVVGVDTAAAEAAAQTAIDRFHDARREVEFAENVLRDVCIVVAVACGIGVDAAFALLTGDPA